jgi:hypothetical protein
MFAEYTTSSIQAHNIQATTKDVYPIAMDKSRLKTFHSALKTGAQQQA